MIAQVDGIEDESSSSGDDDDEVIPVLMLCHGWQVIGCFWFRPLMCCVDVFLRRCSIPSFLFYCRLLFCPNKIHSISASGFSSVPRASDHQQKDQYAISRSGC